MFGLWCLLTGLSGGVRTLLERSIDLFTKSQVGSFMTPVTFRDIKQFGDDAIWLIAGAYLLFGGRLLINRFCSEVVGRCDRCGYDMSGSKGAAGGCPECGLGIAKGHDVGDTADADDPA